MLVNHNLLDYNMLPIDVPRGIRNLSECAFPRLGEITFGGLNSKYESSDFSVLPLVEYDDQAWTVEAQSLRWDDSSRSMHEDFVPSTLAFITADWFLALPGTSDQQSSPA